MTIIINRNCSTPIYLQIKNQIQQRILSGELSDDYVLLSERNLAKQLKVDRSTVVKAYMELKADGLVESFVGKGTVVLPQLTKDMEFDKIYTPKIHWNQMINQDTDLEHHDLIAKIMEATQYRKIISFAGGIPASNTYPIEIFKNIQNQCMDKYKEKLFMPTSIYGCMELRNSIKNHLESRGINAATKEIMITSGSQQGIYYFAKLFIEAGDVVLMEEPTYLGAIEIFKAAKGKVIGVPIDKEGIKTDVLENLLLRYRPKFIYLQSSFQNPSGVTLSMKRRKELLKLAYFYQIPILEDDGYGEINFSENRLPSLKALDKSDYVVYLGTFSKALSLGMRIGWVAANEFIINKFSKFKQITDFHSNTMTQYMLSEFLNGGYYQQHIKKIIEEYKSKRDLMCTEILKYKVDGLQFSIPEGGYFLWCKLPENVRLTILMNQAIKEGVMFMPPDPFYCNGSIGDTYIRLNYTYPTREEIKKGVKALMEAIKKSRITTYAEGKSRTNDRNPII
ncbi:DNA-binding transcriptional regulator, MocR family, contains an aminotransferase domain [Natronincola peptidivorans]|uniref:DNA-binding transcriptional regulator, MocR family, contains an aminotransferase domain n=1 Tax=Natronincola peptidivorans TaxID=426128 RepID=A0A1I0AUB4_9FIRM|nr:PLP-dependent aminotransferase family protein [Natronincola peptidivorans]SES97780.1 DNA-binding transcriptional regulator, MocR family, contains an aminotransferase domain [Natronincola peptidivorans]